MVGTTSEESTKNYVEHLISIRDTTSEMLSVLVIYLADVLFREIFGILTDC